MWKLLVAALLLVTLSAVNAEVVTCDDYHPAPYEHAVVKRTKHVTLIGKDVSTVDFTPRNNVTEGDCSVVGDYSLHIHDCVEPVENAYTTLTYDIQLTPNDPFEVLVIYCVEIIDEVGDGDGGMATIDAGGVGSDHVLIRLRTQPGKGMAFFIEIFYDSTPLKRD